jgi:HK97 family phage portal protein
MNTGTGVQLPNVERQMRAYAEVGILFAIVSRIAEAVAEADWGLYRKGGDEPVTDHPVARLWENPNVFMDQDEFIETAQQHFELAGETDWKVGRSTTGLSKMPMELWPVRPDRIEPVPHPDKFIEGWVYRAPGSRVAEPWRNDEVIQMKRPNPLDPYRGLSPVAAAMVDVYGEQAAASYNTMFFRNSAEPGGIVRFPERLDDEAFDEFVDRWRAQHQGVNNAHRVAVLEGAEWIERKYTMRDMQFEELRKLNRELIRQAFGFPKSMLGDTEDVNKAAAIAGEYVFVRWMVRPRLNRIQATLNSQLLPLFGEAVAKQYEFRFTTPVPADKELEILELDSQADRAKTLVDAGFDPAAVLEWVGIPAMAFQERASAPEPPEGSTVPPTAPAARRGRRTTADDPGALAVWEQAQEYRRERPEASIEVIAGLTGVSERTLRRYQGVFGE